MASKKIKPLMLVLASFSFGFIVAAIVWGFTPTVLSHVRARSAAVLRQAEDFPDGGIVVVGDSITEFTAISSTCGKPVLNAGLAGSQVSDWMSRLSKILEVTKPSIVVFALGVNDARTAERFSPSVWEHDYRALIAQAHGAKVVVMGVQPIEPHKRASDHYSAARADNISQRIHQIAAGLDLQFIAPMPSAIGKTIDGVHLNQAGRRAWRESLTAVCE